MAVLARDEQQPWQPLVGETPSVSATGAGTASQEAHQTVILWQLDRCLAKLEGEVLAVVLPAHVG